ncbi:MAG: DNA gyrase subunit A [Dehalococcoidia bacterium]|nr:DNA gyrase subunit A [Dehalococcoidia bacterium]
MVSNIGNIRDARIEEELRGSYLDYAMSVIVARALPDVRDGLKPVQRRILYGMEELSMRPNAGYKKSARLVGEVLGKYHPHGDVSVYDAMVRMAQDFSLRYPLVDGQGNFGSIDDDPPAAMRYTEARMARIALEMLADIDKDTVNFADNFDGSLREPTVLPARLPNLLVNGATGIAVGMATSIPPHNLREVCDAVIYYIDNPAATSADLLRFVKGPDFPTGGIMLAGPGRSALYDAYERGQGRVVVRAKIDLQEIKRTSGRQQLVVTEIPYMVNKATLVEKIASLVRDKRIEGISDVRDESDREGMRVVVELRGGANPDIVLNNLYKHTQLQAAFSINMLALVNNQPTVLGLQGFITHFVDFRVQVVTRRAQFDLKKAQDRAHILAGLRIALDNLDAVIKSIRASADVDVARQTLIARFHLTVIQAQAILDMQLRRLAALERQKIDEEFGELAKKIDELETLLADQKKILALVRTETVDLQKSFGDARRTEISEEAPDDVSRDMSQFIQHADMVVMMTQGGYIKRLPLSTYRRQNRGGKGVAGITTREDDVVQQVLVCDTHEYLYMFTNKGRVFAKRCYDVPESSRTARGTLIGNVINLQPEEEVSSIIPIKDITHAPSLVLGTKLGEVKRMPATSLASVRQSGLIAMDLEHGDEMVAARLAADDDEIVVVTRQGKGALFPAKELTVRSRQAGGVRAIRLKTEGKDKDEVIAMDVASAGGKLFTVTVNGYGKVTELAEFSVHHRGGGGVIAHRVSAKTGEIAWAGIIPDMQREIVLASSSGQVERTTLEAVSSKGRNAMGVLVMRMDVNDHVVAAACMAVGIASSELAEGEMLSKNGSNGAKPEN